MRTLLVLFYTLMLLQLVCGCKGSNDQINGAVSNHTFNENFGVFEEVGAEEAKMFFDHRFPVLNNGLFFYAHTFDSKNNYTPMFHLGFYYKKARELFYLNDLGADVSKVFVEMTIDEAQGFSLYNPKVKKTSTLTNKSFYKARFDYTGDTIFYTNEFVGKAKNSQRLLKQEQGYVLEKQLVGYRNNKSIAPHFDASKYLYSSDTIFGKDVSIDVFNKQNYQLVNDENFIWKTVGSSSEIRRTFDEKGNLVEAIDERGKLPDSKGNKKYLAWIMTNEYNAFGLLMSTKQYKEIVKNGERVLNNQFDYTYKYLVSDKNYLKLEIYKSTKEMDRKLYVTIVFNKKGQWVKVEKQRAQIVREIRSDK